MAAISTTEDLSHMDLRERVKQLVEEFGWNTTCYQILNPGIRWWFSEDLPAVVGYVDRHDVRVVAGAPVCAEPELNRVVDQFESDAAEKGLGVCYFGAEDRIRRHADADGGYSCVTLGAQPFWSPSSFVKACLGDRSLRAQLNRARNKDVYVEEWDSDQAANSVGLRRCLDEWLQTRGLPPMHFLVEPETLGCLDGRRLFVAVRGQEVVGFTVLSPVPCRNGYLTEQFVHGRHAPNGAVELGLFEALQQVCSEGAEYVTMGIVPLSQHQRPSPHVNPFWLHWLSNWIRAHGRRFYNFDGLDCFKSKFHPDGWEPIYAISREPSFSFHTLYAIAGAFCECPPPEMVAKGLWRAVRQEAKWLAERTN